MSRGAFRKATGEKNATLLVHYSRTKTGHRKLALGRGSIPRQQIASLSSKGTHERKRSTIHVGSRCHLRGKLSSCKNSSGQGSECPRILGTVGSECADPEGGVDSGGGGQALGELRPRKTALV